MIAVPKYKRRMSLEQPTAKKIKVSDEKETALELDDDVGDLNVQASHMEADSDEEDPEILECPKCGKKIHVTDVECTSETCDYVICITKAGYFKDGFVVEEGVVEYDDDDDSSDEDSACSESSDDEGGEDEPSPWRDDNEDSEWEP